MESAPVLAKDDLIPQNTLILDKLLFAEVLSRQIIKPVDKLSFNHSPKMGTSESEDFTMDKNIIIIKASGFSIRTSALGDSTRALIAQKYLFKEYGHPVTLFLIWDDV